MYDFMYELIIFIFFIKRYTVVTIHGTQQRLRRSSDTLYRRRDEISLSLCKTNSFVTRVKFLRVERFEETSVGNSTDTLV